MHNFYIERNFVCGFGKKNYTMICDLFYYSIDHYVVYVSLLLNMEKHREIQLFEFQEVGTNLFHFTILNLVRFLIEVNGSENDFQTIDGIDA